MSRVIATSVCARATSSRHDLQSSAHRLEGQPHDNESQPRDPTNDPEAAVREDTARRLAELLDRPGVTGALITDLLDSNNVDDINHETNLDHAIHESGHTRTPLRGHPRAAASKRQLSDEHPHVPSRGHPRATT